MDDLFLNHLLFMATHRGSVRLAGRDVFIEGPTAALTSLVPGSCGTPIAAECAAVRLAPSSGDAWPGKLETLGFTPAESLTYMELADNERPLSAADIDVTTATTAADADKFAEIQSAGFATGSADVDDWWRTYFAEQARANYNHPAQRFYLGWVGDRAVTTTLAVRTPGVTGVYAVATRPDYRNRGVSAAVLDRARREALASGFPRVVLQAITGSYAERYYSKLGFFTRYRSQVWRR